MKKILYIAPIHDGTGYAHMANNTILILDAAGHDVTVRKQKLTGQTISPPNKVIEMERKDVPQDIDVVIQHTLPPHFIRYEGVKNIGYFHWETDNIMPSGWHLPISLMDELWVSWEDNANMLQRMMDQGDLPSIPIRVVTGAVSQNRPVDGFVNPMPFSKLPYTFYHIGDCSARKGTEALLTAFYREFTASDNVQLILKSYVDGKSTQESINHIREMTENIKMSLRDRTNGNWPTVHLIAQYLTDDGIAAIHETGDCFVTLERGAAWNIPAFEAWQMGKSVIAPNYGGQTAFLQEKNNNGIQLLHTQPAFVYGMKTCGYPGVYTSYENWRVPLIDNAQYAMRFAYNTGKKTYNRSDEISLFSLENIAKEMVEI